MQGDFTNLSERKLIVFESSRLRHRDKGAAVFLAASASDARSRLIRGALSINECRRLAAKIDQNMQQLAAQRQRGTYHQPHDGIWARPAQIEVGVFVCWQD